MYKGKTLENKMPAYDSNLFDLGVHTWDEIAQVMCQAELVYEMIITLNASPVIVSYWFGAFMAFLIVSIAAEGTNLIFIIIQCFNHLRVVQKTKKMKRRE